jgi:hypothetical protein
MKTLIILVIIHLTDHQTFSLYSFDTEAACQIVAKEQDQSSNILAFCLNAPKWSEPIGKEP